MDCRRARLGVVGHTGIDYVMSTDTIGYGFQDGSIHIHSIDKYLGGTGMNTAYSAALNGLETTLLTCGGKDFRFPKEFTDEVHVKQFFVEGQEDISMPICFIYKDDRGNQEVFIYDETLDAYNRIEKANIHKGNDAIHITTTPVEFSLMCARDAQEESDTIVSWAPGQNLQLWDRINFIRMIQNVNILFINKDERDMIEYQFRFEPNELLELMDDSHDRLIVNTRGEHGCILYSDKIDGYYKLKAVQLEEEAVVNPVGCGDAFTGAFLAKLLQRNEFAYCAKYASTWASFIAETEGCQTNYPTRSECENRMDSVYGK